MIYNVTIEDETHRVELLRIPTGWICKFDGCEFSLDVAQLGGGWLSLLINGKSYEARQEISSSGTEIIVDRERFGVVLHDPRSLRSRGGKDKDAQGPKKIIAPMPGKVVRILVQAGSDVEFGQPVLVIEAMKMQNELKAPKKGKLRKVNVSEGAAVEAGQTLGEVD